VFDLWRLRRERRRVFFKYEKEIAAAGKNSPEAYQLMADQHGDCESLDCRMDFIMDQDIRLEAQELDIVLPPVDQAEMWRRDQDQNLYLSQNGRFHVRSLIDEEKGRRFDVKTRWVTKIILPVVASLVGILGAITGLIAVIHSQK
jgi:hypothetical protein